MRKKLELTKREIEKFEPYLRHDEREPATVEAYLRALRRFARWADGRSVTKELAVEWKAELSASGYRPVSVNAMLAAVNKFFTCMGREDCKVKYLRLVQAAHEKGDRRLELLLETICATGIRVGEVRYITVETVRAGRAQIALKWKIRTILLPGRLCRRLEKYARKQKIASGEIFITRGGMGMGRKQVWAEMKRLSAAAGVEKNKVFPHNLRSLFAWSFYGVCRDVVRLADVLGHSSIETTRIYLMSTGREYLRQLDQLGLVW